MRNVKYVQQTISLPQNVNNGHRLPVLRKMKMITNHVDLIPLHRKHIQILNRVLYRFSPMPSQHQYIWETP